MVNLRVSTTRIKSVDVAEIVTIGRSRTVDISIVCGASWERSVHLSTHQKKIVFEAREGITMKIRLLKKD